MQRVTQIPECKPRCRWARRERSISYHDAEWGTKQTDDRMLFELLVLEGAQAGLSRETILRKRAACRAVFDGFDPSLVARFDDARVDALLGGAGIVRHRGTIESWPATLARSSWCSEAGSFAAYLWGSWTAPAVTRADNEPLPARDAPSDRIGPDLGAHGFRFVGPTIVSASLQAPGLVDDHSATCFRAR